jgi:hypothetical protein
MLAHFASAASRQLDGHRRKLGSARVLSEREDDANHSEGVYPHERSLVNGRHSHPQPRFFLRFSDCFAAFRSASFLTAAETGCFPRIRVVAAHDGNEGQSMQLLSDLFSTSCFAQKPGLRLGAPYCSGTRRRSGSASYGSRSHFPLDT